MKRPPTLDLKALRENAIALDELGVTSLDAPTPAAEKKRRPPSSLPLEILTVIAFL